MTLLGSVFINNSQQAGIQRCLYSIGDNYNVIMAIWADSRYGSFLVTKWCNGLQASHCSIVIHSQQRLECTVMYIMFRGSLVCERHGKILLGLIVLFLITGWNTARSGYNLKNHKINIH